MRNTSPDGLSPGLVLGLVLSFAAPASAAEFLDPGAPWPKYRVEELEQPEGIDGAEPTALELADLDGDRLLDLLIAWRTDDGGVLAAAVGGSREWRREHGSELLPPVILARTPAPIRHLAVADVDWDGTLDVLMALEGRSRLDWFSLASAQPVDDFETLPLPGPVTALAALDYGRRDSAPSPVVGIETAKGPQLVLFPDQKSPAAQSPLLVPAGGVIRRVSAGNLDGDAWWDLVVATDHGLAVVKGTDSGSRSAAREMAVSEMLTSDGSSTEFVVDRFERSTTHRLTVAGVQGIRLVDPMTGEWSTELKTRSTAADGSWVRSAWSGVGRGPVLVQPDPMGLRLHGALAVDRSGEWRAAETTVVELGGPVSRAETGRISRDAIDDLVVVLEGSNRPVLLVAAPRSIFGITTDSDHNDGACDADCTLREAIIAANANPGFDEIRTIPGLYDMGFRPGIQLPDLTDPVRINEGTWQWWIHGDACTGGCNGLVVTADTCALENLTVYNFDKTPAGQSGKGIVLLGSYHSWLESVKGDNNEGHGIVLSDATDTSLRGSFSYNLGNGIHLDPGSSGTTANNHAWGVSAVANHFGIRVDNVPDTMIGGTTTGAFATVEQNTLTGIHISGASATGTLIARLIPGYFGTPGNGDHGVYIEDAGATSVGTPVSGAKCFIEANAGSGVRIQTSTASHQVANAEIFDNGAHGVIIAGGSNVGIGPDVEAFQNTQHGFFLTHDGVNSSHHITVEDSVMGSSGNFGSTGNTGYGLSINGAYANIIGSLGHGNVITMNGAGGVWLGGSGAIANFFTSNYIGTNAAGSTGLGNGGPGITVVSAPRNAFGGTVGGGNVIAWNQGDGIAIVGDDAVRNGIRYNSIHHNLGHGIDLNNDGVTPPDQGDGDSGPNGLINQPLIGWAESCGGTTYIGGGRWSAAGTYAHDLFANTECDPSGWGEGQTYIGWFYTVHADPGNYSYNVEIQGDLFGQFVSSNTTGNDASSSEFSNCVEVTAGRPGDATADCDFAADDLAAIINVVDNPAYPTPGNPDADGSGVVDSTDLFIAAIRPFF